MQTHKDLKKHGFYSFLVTNLTLFYSTVIVSIAAILLTGCSPAITIEGLKPVQKESSLNTCEKTWAQSQEIESRSKNPLYARGAGSRILTPLSAAQHWQEAALQCPTRIEEAVIRSAFSWQQAYQQAQESPIITVQVTNPQELTIKAQSNLRQAAALLTLQEAEQATLAEDEAGFYFTLLAAGKKEVASSLLNTGDQHHAVAQLFASAHPNSDPRKSAYPQEVVLQHTGSILDPARGISAPTEAVITANCARSLLQVTRNFANTPSDSGNHSSKQSSRENLSNNGYSEQEKKAALHTLVSLTTAHFYTAVTQGYPANEALFLKG